METANYIKNNDAFVFELDDVIYPVKDFYLQVYYLFGQFIEYSEQLDGNAVLKFMQETYAEHGHEGIFESTAKQFGIADQYKLNFDLLLRNVRLPLKLLLYDECLQFMKAIVLADKPLFLMVSGNPEAQLNKIRQIEWQGLEQYLRGYFVEEIASLEEINSLAFIAEKHQLEGKRLLIIDKKETNDLINTGLNVNYLAASKLIGK